MGVCYQQSLLISQHSIASHCQFNGPHKNEKSLRIIEKKMIVLS